MEQNPRGRQDRGSIPPLYEGNGEEVRIHYRSRAERQAGFERNGAVRGASAPIRQPLGRSEELRQQQEARYFSAQDDGWNEQPHKKPRKKKKHSAAATVAWTMLSILCLLCIGALALLVAPQLWGVQYATLPNYAFPTAR